METVTGSKGSDVYKGTGSDFLELSVSLCRGVSYLKVKELMDKILSASSSLGTIEDLIVLAFQTRDIRNGKGERLASEHLFKCLLSSDVTRNATLDILDLIPYYGSWRDLFSLGTPYCGTRLVDIVEKQFLKDEAALEEGKSISLLAKWMPRENHPDVSPFATCLVPTKLFCPTRMKFYRKRVSRLNKALDTVEIKMCANRWTEINPLNVPGRAMQKYSSAFLNEKRILGTLRYSHSEDRMACREIFQIYFQDTVLGELRAKSSTLYPHEVVKTALNLLGGPRYNPEKVPYDEMNRLEGIWKSMVEDTLQIGTLRKSLAMCDFSGSMQTSPTTGGLPYWVSLSLGLLISQVTMDEFKDKILTFDSRPTFHTFPAGGLFSKLASIHADLGQGLSTDFQAAMDLILATLKEKRVQKGEEPENLIVLTDMAWDKACSSSQRGLYSGNKYRHVVKTNEWQTHIEMIREAFKRGGEDLWGAGNGWKMPRIVIWNLAAESHGFHATSETDGVVMISGWSPNLLKVVQENGVVVRTPTDALKVQLNDGRYDLVRNQVREFFKKIMNSVNDEEESFAYY